MLGATHQQLEGQAAVLRGNRENNDQNIRRIEEELKGQEDRSGGVVSQIQSTQERISQLDGLLEEKKQALEELSQKLTAMTASAQGMTREYLQLRGKEASLSAETAGHEADIRGLEQSIIQSQQRLDELQEDLKSGAARKQEAKENLDHCRAELKRAQEDASAANNTIAGYTLRHQNRGKIS